VIEKVQSRARDRAQQDAGRQLYNEFKELFPERGGVLRLLLRLLPAEAYLPTTDTYIEKDSAINEQIDRMRHSATTSLFERNDVIVVSSVSCIYGLGSPRRNHGMLLFLEQGQRIDRNEILRKLVDIQYSRTTSIFSAAPSGCAETWSRFSRHRTRRGDPH